MMAAHPTGPLILNKNRGGEEYNLDIIFVHGLRGHREKTWTDTSTKTEVFWPRDILLGDMSTARVISWGYNANVVNFASSVSQLSVFGHAKSLLSDIADERVDCPVR